MSAHPSVSMLTRCWESIDDLLKGLSADQWSTPSLCPAWDISGVVIHLVAVEEMLLGSAPSDFAENLPFDQVVTASQDMASLDPTALLARFRDVTAQRRHELESLDADGFDTAVMTPVGPGTYGRFMNVRVFDNWVHEQDMRLPLGQPAHEDGPAAERSIDEIEMSLPYIVGKRIGLADGMSITFELTGPVERMMSLRVDGRATPIEPTTAVDVMVTCDSTTFALLACGRVDPEGPISDGSIQWSGDDHWGATAARNLRFTM